MTLPDIKRVLNIVQRQGQYFISLLPQVRPLRSTH